MEGGHTTRWATFVNCKLSQQLGLTDLPGVGPVGEKNLKAHGLSDMQRVFGKFLEFEADEDRFEAFLRDTVGVKAVGNNNNPHELATALTAKWNSLCSLGQDLDKAKKGAEE